MPDAKADKTAPRSSYGQYELLYDEEIDKVSFFVKDYIVRLSELCIHTCTRKIYIKIE